VAKAVLGLPTTVALIERLAVDRALRRICGYSRWKKLPDEATFSRAFAEFAESRLAERVHEALIKAHLSQELIGHVSRDGTAIRARERPAKPAKTAAACCSAALRAHCRDLGHVPLIDHNLRGGEKIAFDPAEAVRYNEPTVAERMNARLKDAFGGNNVWVKGHAKVMSHLMFGLLVLTTDQLIRLLQ